MRVLLLNADYRVAERLDKKPICGEDFCDSCGDCLYCYNEDKCYLGEHMWFVYQDKIDEWRVNHQ